MGESAAEDRLAMRAAWQRELRAVLARRTDPTQTGRELSRLLREPQRLWPPEHAGYRAARRNETLRLIADVASTLTVEQRRYFMRRANGWAEDFDSLVCRG